MSKTYKVIGLMSGSSLDGLDIAYCHFQLENDRITSWSIEHAETIPFSDQWVARLANLPYQKALDFAKTHVYFGRYMAELVKTFFNKNAFDIDFIASHGHTIFHQPSKLMTTQIGDGAALAQLTQKTVISDFRTADIALGGEGTPLAPVADYHLFKEYDCCLNIGGIANISYYDTNGVIKAFDIAPANQIFNYIANKEGLSYDKDGLLGQQGQVEEQLLSQFQNFPYYKNRPPKSLDNSWIHQNYFPLIDGIHISNADKLKTAYTFFINELVYCFKKLPQTKTARKLLITGGGSHNTLLVEMMQTALNPYGITVVKPSATIVDFKEALLMALLGVLRMEGLPNCFASVTGAKKDTVNGAVYSY